MGLSVWLVYENIPESTDTYFIHYDFITEEDHKVLDLCHYHFVNASDQTEEVEAALQKLSEWLEEGGKYAACKLEQGSGPHSTPGDTKLIVTGFLL